MSWLQDKLRSLADATAAQPLECPRGWGSIAFNLEIGGFAPFFSLERKCPIGGVTKCDDCRHPLNPANVEQLRTQLEQLEQLHADRKLSDREYAERRQKIIALENHGEQRRRDAFRIAAWVLGPLGVLSCGAGLWLTQQHGLSLALTGLGGVMLALALSFAWLARPTQDRPEFTIM